MPSGPHRPTLKSLAQGLGLSVSTVSKALKGAPDVGAQTVASVRMAAEAAGYVPDLRGVKLRTGQTFSLYYQKAVAPMQDVPDAIVAAQIETIASSLSGTPYQLQIVPWNTATEDPLPIIRRIVEGRLADGIVLDSTMPTTSKPRLSRRNTLQSAATSASPWSVRRWCLPMRCSAAGVTRPPCSGRASWRTPRYCVKVCRMPA
jgi:LacI family transcriptional regulator